MRQKEKFFALVLVVILLLIFYIAKQNDNKERNSINNYKQVTVGKVFKIVSRRSFTKIYYYYFCNGLRYETWKNGDLPESEVLNNFYRVNFSKENPSYSEILLKQEVTDSTEIVNAGFEFNR